MDNRIYELRDLDLGASFEVVGLESDYRKLSLVNLTAGAAFVKGESSLDDETIDVDGNKKRNWRVMGDSATFSLRTPVRIRI